MDVVILRRVFVSKGFWTYLNDLRNMKRKARCSFLYNLYL